MKFDLKDIQPYLDQVEKLQFSEVSDDTYEILELEGLDEECDCFDKSLWLSSQLNLIEDDKTGLIEMNQYTLEKFNYFDIVLKERYNGAIIDLINYDLGTITLVKVKNKDDQ